jgi:hypothetical protein
MGRVSSEVKLHSSGAAAATAAPRGTLSIAKGVADPASPFCHLGAGWCHAARSPRGGLLALDRLAGEVVMPPDEPRPPIPAPQGQHKASGDLTPAHILRPAGSRRWTRSSTSACGHGSCTSPGCYPRGAGPAGGMWPGSGSTQGRLPRWQRPDGRPGGMPGGSRRHDRHRDPTGRGWVV